MSEKTSLAVVGGGPGGYAGVVNNAHSNTAATRR